MAKTITSLPLTVDSWAARLAVSLLADYPEQNWQWHYEHGLFVKAIYETGCTNGDPRFLDFAGRWLDAFVLQNGEIRTYRAGEFNLDQINPGKLLFHFYRATGEPRFARAIQILADQLKNQPRTPSGGFWHKLIYPNQMWLDGLFMAAPFYAEYARDFDAPQLFDDIVHQFFLVAEHTRDPQTGLHYHGWDESKVQRWANPQTGCSPNFWGRAIGWFAMALVDTLDFFPLGHPSRPTLIEILQRLATAMLRFQDANTGLWFQVVNWGGRAGNYTESSASAMLTYAFAKSVRKGYLSPEYRLAAQRAYQGLLEHKIRIDASGKVSLEGVCSVAGLGGEPYRDGSYAYYVGEPVAANDFKGAGPFILAALEMETAGKTLPGAI